MVKSSLGSHMSPFAQYRISSNELDNLREHFDQYHLQITCTHPKYLQDDKRTFYTEWEIKNEMGYRVIMWAHEKSDGREKRNTRLTLVTPDSHKGFKLVKIVEHIIVSIGGTLEN